MSDSQAGQRTGQNILIAHYDLFENVGGGQSVYRAIIAARPNDTFYYFRRREDRNAIRPANAVGIAYTDSCQGPDDERLSGSDHFFWVYLECRNMAASAARHCPGVAFDVLDVPDFGQSGLFLAHTLRAENIRAGITALSLHGTLSTAFRGGWPASAALDGLLAELGLREHLQFRAADVRYAISDFYARQWQQSIPVAVNRLDPLCVINAVSPSVSAPSRERPDVAFVGRREKGKGPDLFVDIAWCLDPSLYRKLILAGPDGPNHEGTGSNEFLTGMALRRGLSVEFTGNLGAAELGELYGGRTVLLLPSRADTFNLVALEAVLAGCPVHVSNRAGMASWLRSTYPELPWLAVDIDCARTAASVTADTLRNYDRRRGELVESLTRRPPRADMSTVQGIYRPSEPGDLAIRRNLDEMAAWFATLVRPAEPRTVVTAPVTRPVGRLRQAGRRLPPVVRIPLRGTVRTLVWIRYNAALNPVPLVRRKTFDWEPVGLPDRAAQQVKTSRGAKWRRLQMGGAGPATESPAALSRLSGRVGDTLVDRVPLFLEMARLERLAGNDLIAATYELRIMRWMGRDLYNNLSSVAATLRGHGFPREAEAAEAMFGSPEHAAERCFALVQSAHDRNLDKPILPLAVLDDRRGPEPRRVAVIASLYNAADKLPTLLQMLAQQTVAQRGELEVVLVDSNSPADERGAMERVLKDHALPVVFARSAERETIQAAWNRGIRLARAPYLSFLGADEGLHPDALSRLAAALDADPGVDWAIADSIVTNVDRDGVYDSDVMPYDRRGYRQDLVYLETCYLSWVGGLYRRSIHDRFGYYDESFRAAGDTEFKNRVMPHIRSVHLTKMLGVFNNYPEARTTQHPRAEIEDLRAWYLWRTRGALRYAFDHRPAADVAALLRDSLSYRKSYVEHLSSDFEFAEALSGYLAGRPDAPAWAPKMHQRMADVLELLRSIELLPERLAEKSRGLTAMHWVYRRVREIQTRAARYRSELGLPGAAGQDVFNDNRYEQHWWSWSV